MRRIVVLIFLGFLAGCFGTLPMPIPKEKGVAIIIDGFFFNEKFECSKEPGKETHACKLSGIRNDELAQKTVGAFRERFFERLEENNIKVISEVGDIALPKVRVNMVYITKTTEGGSKENIRYIQVFVSIVRKDVPPIVATRAANTKGVEVDAIQRNAKILAERFANDLAVLLDK